MLLSVSAPHDTHSATHASCQEAWPCCFQQFHMVPLLSLGAFGSTLVPRLVEKSRTVRVRILNLENS